MKRQNQVFYNIEREKMVGGIGPEKERDETLDVVCAKVRGAIEEKAKVS